jgi:arabinan endo-1,5-alpha-L-arabinosidase
MKKLIYAIFFFLMSLQLFGQDLKNNISIHDPAMAKQGNRYYLFGTGNGISYYSSTDKINWKAEQPIFKEAPEWALKAIPGFKNHIWAPDISYFDGLYYLYYSVSSFGKNKSCIGLATNKTLNPNDADYLWIDHGKIIQSIPGINNWNAIDPNLISDKQGRPYLAFGSFWEGLKLVKLKRNRLEINQKINHLPTIASRVKQSSKQIKSANNQPDEAIVNAIEAPYIFYKNDWYYLFVSTDYCCKGPKSTYKMVVGRSKKLQGPYLDKDGIALANGGGSLLLAGDKNWYGVGHNAVYTFDDEDYIVFHGYDVSQKGKSKLRIEVLKWENNWPYVDVKPK